MSRRVRAIAIGNRVVSRGWSDYAAAVTEIERIVGLALPHLATDRPNLIVLGELLGLPGAVMGQRGWLARQQPTAPRALTALALPCLPAILSLQRQHAISLAQALLLARTDALYRPLATTLPRLARQYNATIVAGTIAPDVVRSTRRQDIRRFGQPDADDVYLPASAQPRNMALTVLPDGTFHRTNKVYLTASEQQMLNLVPGTLAEVEAIDTPAGRLGVAISLDAFTPDYVHHLARQGTEIIVQPDANDQAWAAPSKTYAWQPQEWLNSVMGSVQATYAPVQANVCAMQVGTFFDVLFDGQSSIVRRSGTTPDPARNFVGNEGFYHTVTGDPFTGTVLAVAPWVVDDPALSEPALSLDERRARLQIAAHQQRFREHVISADITLE